MSNTKTIKIEDVEIVIKTTITYAEDRAIKDVYLNSDGKVTSDIVNQADKLGVESVIISINGNTTEIYKHFSELPLLIARQAQAEIKKVLDPKVDTPETAIKA